MRKPRIPDVKLDAAGTRRLRAAMAGRGSVKITINLDADSLAKTAACRISACCISSSGTACLTPTPFTPASSAWRRSWRRSKSASSRDAICRAAAAQGNAL